MRVDAATATATAWRAYRSVAAWPRFAWIVIACLVGVVALVFSGAVMRSRRRSERDAVRRRRHAMCSTSETARDTIFVSVPNYRDHDCAATLMSLFNRARCPMRVRVGVYSQLKNNDKDPVQEYARLCRMHGCDAFVDNVRHVVVDAEHARGPMFARSEIERRLYRGERWYLNVDAHTRFCDEWDQCLVDAVHETARLRRADNDVTRVVLTAYPNDIAAHVGMRVDVGASQNGQNAMPASVGTYLRAKRFDTATGMLEIDGPQFKRQPSTAIETPFLGFCFCFSHARRLHECPVDPHCDYAFTGEETSMATRLWTRGYTLYNPHMNVVWHRWNRGSTPTFWANIAPNHPRQYERREAQRRGARRLWRVLGMQRRLADDSPLDGDDERAHNAYDADASLALLEPGQKYGLGRERTLHAYMQFSGVDWDRQLATSNAFMGVCGGALDGYVGVAEMDAKFGSLHDTHAARRDAEKRGGASLLRRLGGGGGGRDTN